MLWNQWGTTWWSIHSNQSCLPHARTLKKSAHNTALSIKGSYLICEVKFILCNIKMSKKTRPLSQILLSCLFIPKCLVTGRLLVRFPWSACWSVFGQDTEPQTAPDVLVGTLHGSHCSHFMTVCMKFCKLLWTAAYAKCPKCKCNVNVWLKVTSITLSKHYLTCVHLSLNHVR